MKILNVNHCLLLFIAKVPNTCYMGHGRNRTASVSSTFLKTLSMVSNNNHGYRGSNVAMRAMMKTVEYLRWLSSVGCVKQQSFWEIKDNGSY